MHLCCWYSLVHLCLHAEHLVREGDAEVFVAMLKGICIKLYEQCQQAAKAFAVAVKTVVMVGRMFAYAHDEVEVANELWVTCGYDDIMDTVSTVIMQVR